MMMEKRSSSVNKAASSHSSSFIPMKKKSFRVVFKDAVVLLVVLLLLIGPIHCADNGQHHHQYSKSETKNDDINDASSSAAASKGDDKGKSTDDPVCLNVDEDYKSILNNNYLNPQYQDYLLKEEQTLINKIGESLREGKLVVVHDIFSENFANQVYDELNNNHQEVNNKNWIRYREYNNNTGYVAFKHILPEQSLSSHDDGLFNSLKNVIQQLIEKLMIESPSSSSEEEEEEEEGSNNNNTSSASSSGIEILYQPAWYKPGDYSTPHTTDHDGTSTVNDNDDDDDDTTSSQQIQFVWNLSKDWNPNWGGAFHWSSSKTTRLEDGFHYPTFNSLLVWYVGNNNNIIHSVTPVITDEEANDGSIKRLSIEGRVSYNKFTTNMSNSAAASKDSTATKSPPASSSSVKDDDDDDTAVVIFDAGMSDENNDEDFSVSKHSSIVEYLNPRLFGNGIDNIINATTTLSNDIQDALLSGKLVVIRNAFKEKFANFVYGQLRRVKWHRMREGSIMHPTSNNVGHQTYKHKAKSMLMDLSDILDGMLRSPSTKQYMSNLSGRDCTGPSKLVPSLYKPGDFSSPHTDVSTGQVNRSLTFIWNLSSKDWKPNYGGALYWHSASRPEEGYQHPTFNTLILFLPTISSVHSVTPVTEEADQDHHHHERLAIHGWYNSASSSKQSPSNFNVLDDDDNPISIEDRFGRSPKDRMRLTLGQATTLHAKIAKNIHKINDVDRRQKLLALQNAIEEEFLMHTTTQQSSTTSHVISLDKNGGSGD